MGWKDAGLDEIPLAKGDMVRFRGQGRDYGAGVGRTGTITYGPSDGYYKATWDDDGSTTKELKSGAFEVFREGLIDHSELQAVTDMLHLEVMDRGGFDALQVRDAEDEFTSIFDARGDGLLRREEFILYCKFQVILYAFVPPLNVFMFHFN